MDASFRQLEALLAKKNLKFTQERRRIYEKVSRIQGHFDADGLYHSLEKERAGIARGTVYRTIPLLLESGVIQKSVGEGKKEFYERRNRKGHHDHMVCIACRSVIEFHCEELENMQDEVCRKHGFTIAFHDHRIFGYCKNCR